MKTRFYRPEVRMTILMIGLSLFATACSSPPKRPDLMRLYAVSSAERPQNPVVLVHGALAARLRVKSNGKEIWPGPLSNFIVNRSAALALGIDAQTLQPVGGHTEAYALFDGVAGKHYYGEIRQALEQAGGYVSAQPGEPALPKQRRYYVFVYDWRQDLVETAAELNRFIDQIRTDYDNPNLKVDIIAHSMGALLTRYFLRYGGIDVLDTDGFTSNHIGAAKTRKVILIGAPNWGSINGLQVFMKGHKLGFIKLYPEILATMPATYQLLPHPDRDWMITADGSRWNRDLYSVETWRRNRWSIFDPVAQERIRKRFGSDKEAQHYIETLADYFERHLRRAQRFYRAISLPLRQSNVRYVVFGGDCVLTPARCLVEQVGGSTKVRFHPSQVANRKPGIDYDKLMLEPGDGRVTKPSLLARNTLDPSVPVGDPAAFPIAYSVFLCEQHNRLTANITLQDNLLNILLTQETTADRMNRKDAAQR